jgi:hypothetical protein
MFFGVRLVCVLCASCFTNDVMLHKRERETYEERERTNN